MPTTNLPLTGEILNDISTIYLPPIRWITRWNIYDMVLTIYLLDGMLIWDTRFTADNSLDIDSWYVYYLIRWNTWWYILDISTYLVSRYLLIGISEDVEDDSTVVSFCHLSLKARFREDKEQDLRWDWTRLRSRSAVRHARRIRRKEKEQITSALWRSDVS